MSRDALDKGSQVVVYLPFGGTFAAVVNAKTKIASGLDVLESQVYFTRDKQSERRHTLRVLDTDPLGRARRAGRRCSTASSGPSGARSRSASTSSAARSRSASCGYSLLIGAQPRKGKTFAGRLIALYAALDPYVNITLIDGRIVAGLAAVPVRRPPLRPGHAPDQGRRPGSSRPSTRCARSTRHIDTRERGTRASCPSSECPQGKLTEKLYRTQPEAARVAADHGGVPGLFRAGRPEDEQGVRAAAVRHPGAWARPPGSSSCRCPRSRPGSAPGTCSGCSTATGTTTSCGSACGAATVTCPWPMLGNESYGEGYDCSGLPLGDEYKGIGILYGLTDDAPTVRTYLADGEDAEVICLAARKIREKARTLSGDALGVEVDEPESDIVADLLEVMGGDAGPVVGDGSRAPRRLASRCGTRTPRPSP